MGDIMPWIFIGVSIVALVMFLIVMAILAGYFRLWIQSFLTGAGITIWDLIGMTFRKVNKDVIVKSKIMAVPAGLGVDQGNTLKGPERHYNDRGERPAGHFFLVCPKQTHDNYP